MKKTVHTISFLVSISLICIVLSGCCLSHEWADATCTEPKTCIKCGKTKGEAIGHQWSEATYEEAKKCSVCGEVEGEPLSPDSIDICYNHFIVDELTFDISQYADKDIVLTVAKNPVSAVMPVNFESSNTSVADLSEEDENSVKLVLKSAGETVVSAICGEVSNKVKITVTDLPKAKRSLIISETTTGIYGSITEYTYNEDASEETAVTTSSLFGTYSTKCTYNEAGQLTSLISTFNGVSKSEYEYDDNGKIISSKGVDGGKVGGSWTGEYSDGKIISEKHYYKNGQLSLEKTYAYDSNGNLVTETNNSRTISSRTEYSYSNGKLLLKKCYSKTFLEENEKLTSTTQYTYDDNGWLLTETTETDDGKKVIAYEYDIYGRLVRTVTDNCETSTYEYDDYGNITVETDGEETTTRVWRIITE